MDDVTGTAADLLAARRGILQVDATGRELSRQLRRNGVRGSERMRADFLRLLAESPELPHRISGVLLSDELLRLRLPDGTALPEALARAGMSAGVRADGGTHRVGDTVELVTNEPDHLRWRLAGLLALGARFACWRSIFVVHPGNGWPSAPVVAANAAAAARFALVCHQVGIVPVIAVDVLRDGAHDVWACAEATTTVLGATAGSLAEADVDPGGVVVAAGMVVEGLGCPVAANPRTVATATAGAFAVLPAGLAGVLLQLGGQRLGRLAANVEAVWDCPAPWPRAFTAGRLLTDPVLAAWRGCPATVSDAHRALAGRLARIVPPGVAAAAPFDRAENAPCRLTS
jgi:fructose-bisphosphate aldolase class I